MNFKLSYSFLIDLQYHSGNLSAYLKLQSIVFVKIMAYSDSTKFNDSKNFLDIYTM
jgi:hypothetical protein